MDSSEKRKYNAEDDGDDPPEAKKRVIGPSLPPSASTQPDDAPSDSGSDSESDDDFGPGLPPTHGGSAAPVESSNRPASPKVHERKESQRDQWMLQPPGQSDWATKIDPTQIRNRKFQTGRSARSGTSKEVDASWVETPEERIRRLGDEVMGVSAPSGVSKQPRTSDAARARSMEEQIKKFHVRI